MLRLFEAQRRLHQKKVTKTTSRHTKRPRSELDPSNVHGFTGSWGSQAPGSTFANPTAEEVESLQRLKVKTSQSALKESPLSIKFGEERSVLHKESPLDYLGRPYVYHATPADIDFGGTCRPPSALVHTWRGHTKGVTSSQLFPRSGHLLLSASQDETIKIWDVDGDKSCLRTIYGHAKAVKRVAFSGDGLRFASCSFDQTVKAWDTETGACLFRERLQCTPHCVAIHPLMPHVILAGLHDRRILQWDTRSAKIVQEYKEHLEAVNSITFIDGNRRFVSTSDDKSIRVWDFDVPVCIKYVADPKMHSMPAAAAHPTEPAIVFQSMNNLLLGYTTVDRLGSTRKRFGGHMVTGLACQPCFSPDGRILASGDGTGQIIFWDWARTKSIKRIPNAHSKPVMDVIWHPRDPSKLISSSWDGDIKMWQ